MAWPNPRFTDNGDGTVTDNLTELIWLKDANCFGQRNWLTALSDANDLADGSCGLPVGSPVDDWRLPNIREIFSLIDLSQANPALSDPHPFINVQSTLDFSSYWSSTTYAGNIALHFAWHVDMREGGVNRSRTFFTKYVWPVRGGN